MTEEMQKVPYARNSGLTPEMEDTCVDEDQRAVTEGVGYHALQDDDGRLFIIKSPELDQLKSLMDTASNGANQFLYEAEIGRRFGFGFGACGAALYLSYALQELFCHTSDLIDLTLGTLAMGTCVFASIRAKQCADLSDLFSEQADKLSDDYGKKFLEINKRQQENDNSRMFR